MHDLTATQRALPSETYRRPCEAEALSAEVTKILSLVAPVTMSAEQQSLWIMSAIDALSDIRAQEVARVSQEVRRSVTRHAQIVPKIAELVAENRRRESSIREIATPQIEGPAPKRHIADRDRSTFTAADWAELNEHLERMGSPVRYASDGTRLAVGSS